MMNIILDVRNDRKTLPDWEYGLSFSMGWLRGEDGYRGDGFGEIREYIYRHYNMSRSSDGDGASWDIKSEK